MAKPREAGMRSSFSHAGLRARLVPWAATSTLLAMVLCAAWSASAQTKPEAQEAPGPTTSLLNEAFARAEGRPSDPDHHPVGGYGYAILTAQGPSAEGGARSYLTNGHLIDGYAVVAWPTRPGVTGESTFIMNQLGVIYEQELGDRTLEVVRRLTAFDPDEKWARVAD
jgi:hypothetical protein